MELTVNDCCLKKKSQTEFMFEHLPVSSTSSVLYVAPLFRGNEASLSVDKDRVEFVF